MLQLKKRRSGSKSVCGFSIILISKGIWSQRVNVFFVFWNPIRTFRELNLIRSSLLQVFGKKGVLRNCAKFTVKHLPQSLFLNKVAGLRSATLSKKRLAQVFSYDFCEISKNTFSYRTPPVTGSMLCFSLMVQLI